MNQILKYIKTEGVCFTLNKIWNKVCQRGQSHTVFLKYDGNYQVENQEEFAIEKLTEQNRKDFEKIKFWNFIHSEDFINNPKQSILLLKVGEEYIAYVAEEHEQSREIHGLGIFKLKTGEGWIGPAYVVKKWRGQGLIRKLISMQMQNLRNIGVDIFFTAINSNNCASLTSFKHMGFSQVGIVDNKGIIVQDVLNILCHGFENSSRR